MEPITVAFVADNLEKAGRVLSHMEVLLESDVDRESLCDVLSWALNSVQREIYAAARVLREQSAPRGAHQQDAPEHQTLADMVTPERLEELKQEFEQAVAMGEQIKEWWHSQHRPDPDQQ